MINEVQTLNGSVSASQILKGNIYAARTLNGALSGAGLQGLSAYEIYVKNGGTLSEEEWLKSLQGSNGVMILPEDDDATIVEKLLSVTNGMDVTTPIFYSSYGGGNEIYGIYQLFQFNGGYYQFIVFFDKVYAVTFYIEKYNGNKLRKRASNFSLEEWLGIEEIIKVSSIEPTNSNTVLWYEITSDVDLNEFYLETNGNDLTMNYQDDLDLDFNIVDNELIVTNDVSELDFNINENKEMEVSYGN